MMRTMDNVAENWNQRQEIIPYYYISYSLSLTGTFGGAGSKMIWGLKDCKLGDLQDELTTTVLICGINNTQIREKLLQEGDGVSLEKIIAKCKICEVKGKERTYEELFVCRSSTSREQEKI
ncbi:hypothetical protein YQE_11221, partial [Dendroctonus ponderosae]